MGSSPPATPHSPTSSPREQPLFFVHEDRPLYGVYHPALKPRPGAPVLVHVHSLGVEHLVLYRNAVRVARAAAAAGIPAFRYHARGHGDSTGDFEAVTLDALAADARAAADHARALSGAGRVVWLGERLGALAAARALAGRDDAAGLALWEPVHRPPDYFRAMLRGMLFSAVAQGERPRATVDELLAQLAAEGLVDVHGYYLHRALVESAADARLEAGLAGWSGPTLLAQVQSRRTLSAPNAALAAALTAHGAPVTTLLDADEPGWHFISNPAWESDALVRGTAEWLDALA